MKLTAKAILDAEQKEIQERQQRSTGQTPRDADLYFVMDSVLEDCIDHDSVECEQALIDTWQPNISLQEWFIAAKKYLKDKAARQ
jgi:hypothetical protein